METWKLNNNIEKLLRDIYYHKGTTIIEISKRIKWNPKLTFEMLYYILKYSGDIIAYDDSNKYTYYEVNDIKTKYNFLDKQLKWKVSNNYFPNLELSRNEKCIINESYKLIKNNSNDIVPENDKFEVIANSIKGEKIIQLRVKDVDNLFFVIPIQYFIDDLTGLEYLLYEEYILYEKGKWKCVIIEDVLDIKVKERTHSTQFYPELIAEYFRKHHQFDNIILSKVHLIFYNDGSNVRQKAIMYLYNMGIFYYDTFDNLHFKGDITDIDLLKVFIKQMSSSVKVLEPITLQEEIIKSIRETIKIYQEEND